MPAGQGRQQAVGDAVLQFANIMVALMLSNR